MLTENRQQTQPPKRDNYHFTTDITDRSIQWIYEQKALSPERPVFVYFAPGAAHSPVQPPADFMARYRGHFDHGWDEERKRIFERQLKRGIIPENTILPPREEEIPSWRSLSESDRKVAARMMEAYAGFVEHTDVEVGRLLKTFDDLNERSSTLVIYITGDNGASAEGGLRGMINAIRYFNGVPESGEQALAEIDIIGGPESYVKYPAGWAFAGNTPFRWSKQVASHLGALRNPVVMVWPDRIDDVGTHRRQFHHVTDVVPTVYELVGITPPAEIDGVEQQPMDGISMAYLLDKKARDSRSRHATQYFEMIANRAIYHDGWMASAYAGRPPWEIGRRAKPPQDQTWELYDLLSDYSQSTDLAATFPDKLGYLRDLWWTEAARNNVLPIDERTVERFDNTLRPSLFGGRSEITLYPGMSGLPAGVAPSLTNRSFEISARIDDVVATDSGVLFAIGGRFAGMTLYLDSGELYYTYNYLQQEVLTLKSRHRIVGARGVAVRFEYSGKGRGQAAAITLSVDGQVVDKGTLTRSVPTLFTQDETMDVGLDRGTAVDRAYRERQNFEFSGRIHSVTLVLD